MIVESITVVIPGRAKREPGMTTERVFKP